MTLDFTQSDFSGGINYLVDPSKLAPNEYVLGFNIRSRYSNLTGVNSSEEDDTAPSGLKQGLYQFGLYRILFVNGVAWWKLQASVEWTAVGNWMSMSSTATRMFAQEVPQAELLFARKLAQSDSITTVLIDPGTSINGQAGALVVQDGVSQPRVIFVESGVLTSRLTNDVTLWTPTDQEYVPIGRQMAYQSGILYIVSPNGKKLYRSVTGRPLDFMVPMTTTGEAGGDADDVAYPTGNDAITCLVPTPQGYLYLATDADESYAIVPNFDTLIFGEPTFRRVPLFDTGAVNQFSFIDVLGDSVFISPQGYRSFNAVLQFTWEGRNSMFSANLSNMLRGIVQGESSCATVFDNYAIFSTATTLGTFLVVYDLISQKFVSLDKTEVSGAEQIRQLTVFDSQSQQPEIWGITSSKVIKLFSEESFETAAIITRGAGADQSVVKVGSIYVSVLMPPSVAVDLSLTPVADNQYGTTQTKTVAARTPSNITIPGVPISIQGFSNDFLWKVTTPDSNVGEEVQFVLTFSGAAQIRYLSAQVKPFSNANPLQSRDGV